MGHCDGASGPRAWSPTVVRVPTVLGALVLGVFIAAAATPALASDVATTIGDILADGGIQTELPGAPPAEEPVIGDNMFRFGGGDLVEEMTAGRLLFQILVFGGLALLAVWILRYALPLIDPRWRNSAIAEAQSPTDPARDLPPDIDALAEADRMAARGAWGEAIHLLLLAAVDHLRNRMQRALRPSWTGRELSARVEIPADGAAALRALVETAERGHFGEKPMGPHDYAACQDHYRAIVQAGGVQAGGVQAGGPSAP